MPRATAIDLAGNDYLGLSQHPLVLSAAASALASYGLGATGSRLVRGTTSLHAQLEEALALFMGTQSALVYSSGYLANLGAIRALAALSPRTLLISDAHCHASMIDGCRLAGAEVAVFKHGDVSHAASLIEPGRPSVILTESVFSVDGDLAPLAALHAVAREAGALLFVDDAHGLGVGPFLSGLAGEPDVIVTATLSKSLGGAGGVVGGPPEFIRHLIDTSRTFIFDTAPPPAVMAGVLAALDITRSADDLRAELHRRAAAIAALPGSLTPRYPASVPHPPSASEGDDAFARPPASLSGGRASVEGADLAEDGGWAPAGGVVSLAAPSAAEAVEWAQRCRDKGVAVGCFRPPSTPDNRSRLRLTVNVGVPLDDFEHALEVIEQCRPSAE